MTYYSFYFLSTLHCQLYLAVSCNNVSPLLVRQKHVKHHRINLTDSSHQASVATNLNVHTLPRFRHQRYQFYVSIRKSYLHT